MTNPGVLQVRRFRKANEFVGDAIHDETRPDACRGVNLRPDDVKDAIAQMKSAGATIVQSGNILGQFGAKEPKQPQ